MKKSLKFAGTLGAALALTGALQSPAAAASWTSTQPTWGTAKCSSGANLTDSNHRIFTCIMYGGGKVQAYAMVMNSSSGDRYLPKTETVLNFGGVGINPSTCAASGMPKQSTRWCLAVKMDGPSGGCSNLNAHSRYYWYADKTQNSPVCG
ncbi:hypothetical protein [Nonomuraea sp. 10N515B]|uniref:hypothetical protein n=1 Tax=Nonomuraea sp. 10N515B TaxID=3457422 RepID=UPI003FCD900A